TLLVSELGGSGGAYGATSYSYNAATNTATFTLPTPLPDGNYRARLAAAAVRDPAGNPLATDALVDFFVLGGDANRDRAVNQLDLDILTMNWQQSQRTFSQGDFSYDGRVDTRDLLILTSHWQGTLPSPAQTMRLAWPSPAQRLPWRMPAAQRDESNVLLAGELL
ncbi:MAG TPA: dockerin type I domain-containing protein, partial [Tepidisphaeraceae bacterium]|nr:dockerin type I domain-containing protein [Tepidisphaeraceae bacterium]